MCAFQLIVASCAAESAFHMVAAAGPEGKSLNNGISMHAAYGGGSRALPIQALHHLDTTL